MPKIKHILLGALVLLPIMAMASNLKLGNGFYVQEETTQLQKARQLMSEARKGGEEASLKSLDKMQSLYNQDKSPILMSYVGSLKAMQARYTILPWMKLTHAKNGSKLLDKAIKKDPKNLVIRFNRFFTYIEFPGFLGKNVFIQEDARAIKTVYENGKLEEGSRSKNYVLEALTLFYAKEGKQDEAKKYLEQIKDANFKAKVSKKLEKI